LPWRRRRGQAARAAAGLLAITETPDGLLGVYTFVL
jgi:hypothetical protein